VKLLNDIMAAEAAGKGTVELPAFMIHTHKKTWTVGPVPAVLTTGNLPAHPDALPSPPA
jgi:hypothetical protein